MKARKEVGLVSRFGLLISSPSQGIRQESTLSIFEAKFCSGLPGTPVRNCIKSSPSPLNPRQGPKIECDLWTLAAILQFPSNGKSYTSTWTTIMVISKQNNCGILLVGPFVGR